MYVLPIGGPNDDDGNVSWTIYTNFGSPLHIKFKLTDTHNTQATGTPSNTQATSGNTQSHAETDIPLINEVQTDEHYIQTANTLGVDLSHSSLSEEQKKKLLVLIGKNRDVFATCTAELGHTDLHPHKIVTQDVPPVRMPQYRTTPEQKAEIERQTKELEEHGIISRSNTH